MESYDQDRFTPKYVDTVRGESVTYYHKIINFIMIIIAIMALILSYVFIFVIPLAIFVNRVKIDVFDRSLSEANTQIEFEYILKKYKYGMVMPPILKSGKKGKKCDVWNSRKNDIYKKAIETYDIPHNRERPQIIRYLSLNSPGIKYLEQKCKKKGQQSSPTDIYLIANEKRTLFEFIFKKK